MNNRINPLENCNPKRESKKDEFEILQLKEENYSLKQLLSSEDYQIQELQKKVSLLEAELSAKDCPIFETKEDIEELKLDRKILLDEVKAAHHDFVLLDNYLTRCLRAFRPLLEDTDTLDYIYDLFENAQKCACDAREKYATSKEKLNHEKRKEERTIKEEEEKIKTYLGEEKSLELVNEIEDALGEEDKDNAKIARSINQLKANLIESAKGNQKLFEEKKRLEENSKLNNSNSHLSSGSLPRFQKVPNTREPSKLKPGGQKGAPGSAPVISEGTRVDEIVELFPKEAEGKSNLECFAGESRYLVEEVVTTKLTKFEQMNAWVEKDGKKVLVKGEFPPEIKARLQYGDSFVSDVVLLNTLGLMSMSRVSLYLSDKFGVTLSASSVAQMLKRVAKCLSTVEEELRKRLIDSKVVHFDETPVNLNGKDVFVHIACNKEYSLLKAGSNRGVKGAKDLGVAEYFKGTSVSDRFSLYRGKLFNHIVKAFCGAHATRDLKQVILKAPEQKWAQKMLDLLKEMNKTAKEAREDGKEKVDTETETKLLEEYHEILLLGFRENAVDSPIRHKYALTQLKSFSEYWHEYTRFFTDLNVEFTNNIAERGLRILKVKEKISGCFRSKEGLDGFLLIESYLQTAKKQNLNPIFALEEAIKGNPEYIFTHKPLEKVSEQEPVLVVSYPNQKQDK